LKIPDYPDYIVCPGFSVDDIKNFSFMFALNTENKTALNYEFAVRLIHQSHPAYIFTQYEAL
jgi:hypothetical protein